MSELYELRRLLVRMVGDPDANAIKTARLLRAALILIEDGAIRPPSNVALAALRRGVDELTASLAAATEHSDFLQEKVKLMEARRC